MGVIETLEEAQVAVLAIPGVVDLAYGEDAEGPHALIFVADPSEIEPVRDALARARLLTACRVVVKTEFRPGRPRSDTG